MNNGAVETPGHSATRHSLLVLLHDPTLFPWISAEKKVEHTVPYTFNNLSLPFSPVFV